MLSRSGERDRLQVRILILKGLKENLAKVTALYPPAIASHRWKP